MTLRSESTQLQRLIRGKTVARVRRLRAKELLIEFTDGTRLYVDHQGTGLEFSVTEGPIRATRPKRSAG